MLGAAAIGFALVGVPERGAAQHVELSAGVLVADEFAPPGARVAPMLSLGLGADPPGLPPLLLEAGFGRSDFNSFGEDFHRYYGTFALSVEWTPLRAPTSVGLRFGLGALVEDDVSEENPGFVSSSNWVEALVPAVVVSRRLASGRTLILTVADFMLQPVNGLLDPSEYSVEHRFRVLLGLGF